MREMKQGYWQIAFNAGMGKIVCPYCSRDFYPSKPWAVTSGRLPYNHGVVTCRDCRLPMLLPWKMKETGEKDRQARGRPAHRPLRKPRAEETEQEAPDDGRTGPAGAKALPRRLKQKPGRKGEVIRVFRVG